MPLRQIRTYMQIPYSGLPDNNSPVSNTSGSLSLSHSLKYLSEHLHCCIFFCTLPDTVNIVPTLKIKPHNSDGRMRRAGNRVGGGDDWRMKIVKTERGKKTQTKLIRPSAEEVSFSANPQWTPSVPLFPLLQDVFWCGNTQGMWPLLFSVW